MRTTSGAASCSRTARRNRTRTRAGGGHTQDVAAIHVVAAAAAASLAGWALLATLERHLTRLRRIWTATAVVTLLVSLAGPLTGTGITTTNRLVLMLLHLVVGTVVITLMAKTAKTTRPSP